jgi:hypothetical protein
VLAFPQGIAGFIAERIAQLRATRAARAAPA